MGPVKGIILSLGKTVIEVAAMFAPIPMLTPVAELLCEIIELCENVPRNKNAARQLRDRCHGMLLAYKDCFDRVETMDGGMKDALAAMELCFADIRIQMHGWTMLNIPQSLMRQNEIKASIGLCHGRIDDCLTKFQVMSLIDIHDWQNEFQQRTQRDHQELVDYLSEIQNSQEITQTSLSESNVMLTSLMTMMQQLLSDNKNAAARVHDGLSTNLYDLQLRSNGLLPNMHLNSGEVTRIGSFPVSGTAAMDIYEGMYLNREKVAVKVVRAVNSSESSFRRFQREVRIWHELWAKDRGNYILPFYGFCQSDGPFPYMISPWQANGNAMTYVKKNDGRVDHKRMITRIAKGIELLHNITPPIIHGDLKAANIVINHRGDPLIADFGLSKIVEDITGIPFTQSRGVSDSYRWFAPEVCVGQGTLTLSSDIYAYGMTVLELMTHSQPYSNIKHTTEVVIRSSRGEHPPRPTDEASLQRGLDEKLWDLLERCWSIESWKRPTIKDILSELEA